jgi:hypothetical protein
MNRNARMLFPLVLALSAVACAAPEEDDASSANGAYSSPRDSADYDHDEYERNWLEIHLDDAPQESFGTDFGWRAKPYLDAVVAYAKDKFDPKAAAYSLVLPSMTSDGKDKWYVVDMRGGGHKVLWVYRPVVKYMVEQRPEPFARCDDMNNGKFDCVSTQKQPIYDPPAQ